MRLHPYCIGCQMNAQERKIRHFDDKEKKLTYMKEICRRFAEAEDFHCSPSLSAEFQKFYTEFWGEPAKDFTEIKKEYNTLMMNLEDNLRTLIQAAPDPLESALIHARIGNYIDFAAMENVDKDTVLSMIENENKESLEPTEYAHFREDMASAKNLVYLTDNCGEIVLDKLAVEILQKLYPDTKITVIVRGEPVVNDATMEDAEMCGLTEIAHVVGNGSNVGGTWLPGINTETRDLLEHADVILSKGQGNFETLHTCGLNIYYLFLCKCERFVRFFDVPLFKGMFINDKRLPSE